MEVAKLFCTALLALVVMRQSYELAGTVARLSRGGSGDPVLASASSAAIQTKIIAPIKSRVEGSLVSLGRAGRQLIDHVNGSVRLLASCCLLSGAGNRHPYQEPPASSQHERFGRIYRTLQRCSRGPCKKRKRGHPWYIRVHSPSKQLHGSQGRFCTGQDSERIYSARHKDPFY